MEWTFDPEDIPPDKDFNELRSSQLVKSFLWLSIPVSRPPPKTEDNMGIIILRNSRRLCLLSPSAVVTFDAAYVCKLT